MKKPTYTYERQYTRNGNPMQRYQIYEEYDIFSNMSVHKGRIAIVFNSHDAQTITEFLNSLPNGTKSYNDVLKWYQIYKPEELKEEFRLK